MMSILEMEDQAAKCTKTILAEFSKRCDREESVMFVYLPGHLLFYLIGDHRRTITLFYSFDVVGELVCMAYF